MKNLIITTTCLIVLLSATLNTRAQKEIKAKSKIDKVSVFINNAQIERSTSINIPEGNSVIEIAGLSQYLDVNSIRLSGKGAFVIMGHQASIRYPEPVEVEDDVLPQHIVRSIERLTDSLELLAFDIHENNARKEALIAEKNILNASTAISKTDTITELKDAIAYYRARMLDINQEWMKAVKIERLLNKSKKNMEERLTALNNYKKNTTPAKQNASPEGVITIDVMADKAIPSAQLDISYITSGVSWTPLYELRVEDVGKPVQLVLKANLTQNTGEDWEKTKLSFSTGSPAVYKTLPVLPVWYISYYYRQVDYSTAGAPAKATRAEANKSVEDEAVDVPYTMANYTQVAQNLISTDYEVNIPYTVLSNSRTTSITLMSEPLSAIYKFYAIPKADRDVFLTAYLTGWEKLSLVQGEANIVYRNSIISKTYINTGMASDTLLVSLGVDKRVVVERKKISDKSKEKVIGSTKERTVHFEITIKNNHQNEIMFTLKDQVPVSNTEEIKVTVDDISGGKLNEISGEIVWQLKLKANETKKLELRYTVKHDKDKPVVCE